VQSQVSDRKDKLTDKHYSNVTVVLKERRKFHSQVDSAAVQRNHELQEAGLVIGGDQFRIERAEISEDIDGVEASERYSFTGCDDEVDGAERALIPASASVRSLAEPRHQRQPRTTNGQTIEKYGSFEDCQPRRRNYFLQPAAG